MKKIRYALAALALIVTLSGPIVLGVGTGSLASAVSSQHVSSTVAAGQSTRAVASNRLGPCPVGGSNDC
jgi:hypothetical protein